jgi:hypothetical protein
MSLGTVCCISGCVMLPLACITDVEVTVVLVAKSTRKQCQHVYTLSPGVAVERLAANRYVPLVSISVGVPGSNLCSETYHYVTVPMVCLSSLKEMSL